MLDLDAKILAMYREFQFRTGKEPTVLLIPRHLVRRFADGIAVSMGAEVHPARIADSILREDDNMRFNIVEHGDVVGQLPMRPWSGDDVMVAAPGETRN